MSSSFTEEMKEKNGEIGVWMTCPMSKYLQDQLAERFSVYKSWNIPSTSKADFLRLHAPSIRALVGNGNYGANAELIESLPSLEMIASHSVGLDQIDLGKCKEKGIKVSYTPDELTDEVADLAIGLVLATSRKICSCDGFVKSGLWKTNGDFGLATKFSGKSVGIIGLGRIGLAIAKRAESFGCTISYCSRSQKMDSGYKYYSHVIDLASNCNILIVACALTSETYHIVNRQVIDALGSEGVVINIGRGAHIDEPELVSALVEGRLRGAGLDVFEHEPQVPEQLFGLDNVVLSPHRGSATEETRKSMADLIIANLEAHFSGKPLPTPVVF